jgi:hypothetical protein
MMALRLDQGDRMALAIAPGLQRNSNGRIETIRRDRPVKCAGFAGMIQTRNRAKVSLDQQNRPPPRGFKKAWNGRFPSAFQNMRKTTLLGVVVASIAVAVCIMLLSTAPWIGREVEDQGYRRPIQDQSTPPKAKKPPLSDSNVPPSGSRQQ